MIICTNFLWMAVCYQYIDSPVAEPHQKLSEILDPCREGSTLTGAATVPLRLSEHSSSTAQPARRHNQVYHQQSVSGGTAGSRVTTFGDGDLTASRS